MDLIKKLITDLGLNLLILDSRLGYNGADEIKSHPFFKNIDWENIKKITPPFIPDVNFIFIRFKMIMIPSILIISRMKNHFTQKPSHILKKLIKLILINLGYMFC